MPMMGLRLTSEQVRMKVFPSADPAVPGVQEEHVSAFLDVVAQELTVLAGERDQAMHDLDKLRRDGPGEAAHEQSVHLLSRAQQNAEQLVADARSTAADISRRARETARDIVGKAQNHADGVRADAVRLAAIEAAQAAASAPAALQAETLGLRSFTVAFRTLMRAHLEAGLQALEQWGSQEDKLAPVPGEPEDRPV
jgi:cell division septum initiation protein DivIVA